MCSFFLTPTQSPKNEPWAQNISLPRGKGLLQLALDLSPCVGISSPGSDSMCTLLTCLSMCCVRHLAKPATLFAPYGGEVGFFCFSTKGVHAGQLPSLCCQEESAGAGTHWHTLLKLISLCLFCVSQAFQPALDRSLLLGDSHASNSEQKCLHSWYQVIDTTC